MQEQPSQPPITIDSYETEQAAKPTSWLGRFWGFMLFILLAGTLVGIPVWWIWERSPLRTWLKITLSIILFVILIMTISSQG